VRTSSKEERNIQLGIVTYVPHISPAISPHFGGLPGSVVVSL
jgi:hypothetical protein